MLASRLHALGILSFTLAWLAYDHYRPWVNFHSEALALLGIGLLALSQHRKARAMGISAPRILVWIAASALIPWMQLFFGISLYAGDALVSCLYLCGLGTAIWLGFNYASPVKEPQIALFSIFYALWFVALTSAAIGLLQWLDLQGALQMYALQTDAGDRAMGNLGQPNQLATLLLMGMAALVWTFERKRINSLGLGVGISFLTLVLVLTQSRAGMLSACIVGIFLVWKNREPPVRLASRWVLVWLTAYGIAVFLLPFLADWLLMGGARSMNPGVDNARITIWKQMLSGIAQSPWWGYGWNETPTAHAAGSVAVLGSMTYTNAHNIVLDILAWNGVPLGLLLTGLCIYWFISRAYKAKQANAIYAMACLLPIAMHSMVEYPFAYSYFLLSAGLMVGIVEASHVGVRTLQIRRNFVGGMLAIWFILGSFMVYEYFQVEEDFRVVRFENLKIGQTPGDYEAPDIRLLSQMGSMLRAARQQAVPGMTAEELENLRKASLRFPYGSLGLRNALALGLNGDPAGATRQMAVIRGMYGEGYYQAAVSVLRDLQAEKYPELAKVITP